MASPAPGRGPGRLKVYLGYAPGVGKTWRLLDEAHALRQRGADVVVGVIETHGRPETTARVEGLEVVPPRRIEYRGVGVWEMDLERVLERRPAVAIVDEAAHTNAPGLAHLRRYQDILGLIAAGIDVVCAFDVQHLESLKDLVERSTGLAIRETVPDTFLKQADQVVTLDLAVEDLVDRLAAGKIFAPDSAAVAAASFFRPENLRILRELLLREVAESLDRSGSSGSARVPHGEPPLKVMVCMASHSPRAPQLLRKGSRLAGRFNTAWYVVYVETPAESPEVIDASAQRRLHENIQLARELGAEVVRLKGREPATAILDFARTHGVGQILIGRSRRPPWWRWFGWDVTQRLLDEGTEFDVQVSTVVERGGAP